MAEAQPLLRRPTGPPPSLSNGADFPGPAAQGTRKGPGAGLCGLSAASCGFFLHQALERPRPGLPGHPGHMGEERGAGSTAQLLLGVLCSLSTPATLFAADGVRMPSASLVHPDAPSQRCLPHWPHSGLCLDKATGHVWPPCSTQAGCAAGGLGLQGRLPALPCTPRAE